MKMDKYLLEERIVNGGIQKLYKFDNGFGASVVSHRHSYGGNKGLWELAVLEFDGDDWSLTYDTPITNDVIGHLNEKDLDGFLNHIKQL
jgi:hypothetical protein